jgi:hypothetical protein
MFGMAALLQTLAIGHVVVLAHSSLIGAGRYCSCVRDNSLREDGCVGILNKGSSALATICLWNSADPRPCSREALAQFRVRRVSNVANRTKPCPPRPIFWPGQHPNVVKGRLTWQIVNWVQRADL